MKLQRLLTERNHYQQLLKQELAKPKEQQQQGLISYYEARQLVFKTVGKCRIWSICKKRVCIF